MSFREIWEASFPPKPKPDTSTRCIKSTVERCNLFHHGDPFFGFTFLLKGEARPYRLQTFGQNGFPELTQPGDEVSLTLDASNQVVGFINHTLAERLR